MDFSPTASQFGWTEVHPTALCRYLSQRDPDGQVARNILETHGGWSILPIATCHADFRVRPSSRKMSVSRPSSVSCNDLTTDLEIADE